MVGFLSVFGRVKNCPAVSEEWPLHMASGHYRHERILAVAKSIFMYWCKTDVAGNPAKKEGQDGSQPVHILAKTDWPLM